VPASGVSHPIPLPINLFRAFRIGELLGGMPGANECACVGKFFSVDCAPLCVSSESVRFRTVLSDPEHTIRHFPVALVLVRFDHVAVSKREAASGNFDDVLGHETFRSLHQDNGCDHGKCAPHVGQILVSLVISLPQWQINVPIAMRLPTMKSGMPTIAPTTIHRSGMPTIAPPTTVQQSSMPITCRPRPHFAAVLRGF